MYESRASQKGNQSPSKGQARVEPNGIGGSWRRRLNYHAKDKPGWRRTGWTDPGEGDLNTMQRAGPGGAERDGRILAKGKSKTEAGRKSERGAHGAKAGSRQLPGARG